MQENLHFPSKTLQFMIGTLPCQNQRDVFLPLLADFIDMDHDLVRLAHKIDWNLFETEFACLYSDTGAPAEPIRQMVGFLILKRLYNLGDETLAAAWVMNPYMQYFCGQAHFQHTFPCDPSDLVHFRGRIGTEGLELIFAHSVQLHGNPARCTIATSDTTVQENNTTFPTDAKLAKKVIDQCNRIVNREGLPQRQSYVRVSKQLVREAYFGHHPRRAKKAKKARRKLRTIAGRLLRELERNLPEGCQQDYQEFMEVGWQAITQQRADKDKIYSLHKPFTACIAKGKAHKKYEFGNKVGIIVHPTRRLVLSVAAYEGNPNDSKTIAPLLETMDRLELEKPVEVIFDRGGRGAKIIDPVIVTTPDPPGKSTDENHKRRMRRRFRKRAGIEPIIGHLKSDHRMGQNYLHGSDSPYKNALLAAAGWNLKKWMEQSRKKIKKALFRWGFQWLFTTSISLNPSS
ncbi:MAG: IS5 family transposase [Balneolaceae bacterium]|nr:IS5 family transposase [Balneolaceae bacterium]